MPMNVIKKSIAPGIKVWKGKAAKISYLKQENLRVPVIFLRSKIQSDKLFLIASGFHLEETSGPLFLLNPQTCVSSFTNILTKMNIVIFPVINQFGLSFKETMQDKHLRRNALGLDYNSAWGFDKEKCQEVRLVEKKLIELYKEYQLVFVLSLHEDSTEPGKGYLWMNNIRTNTRKTIQLALEKKVDKKILLQMKSTVGLRRGRIESGFSVVDAKDESFENFTSEILGIPTLLSEAPFGLDLDRRIAFHRAALTSIPF